MANEETSIAEPKVSIHDALWRMTEADADKFSDFFQRLRKAFPQEVAHACLSYIAQKGMTAAGQKMAFWLMIENKDLRVLLDPEAISVDLAKRAVARLNKWSSEFLVRFVKEAEPMTQSGQLMRVLSLVPALGDYGVLLFWLRKLGQSGDAHVRSRAVKLMCVVRPSKAQIVRQMLDANARVRANALECLWYAKLPEARALLKAALADPHQRVVANALAGLYLHGDTGVMEKITELCQSPHASFRSSMAWCLGFIQSEDGIPLLRKLVKDPSVMVRKRALLALQILGAEEEEVAEAGVSTTETTSSAK